MTFKIGDLVSIVSSINPSIRYSPPALIIDAYISEPKILLNDKRTNKLFLEAEDLGPGQVYDIFYKGEIEEAVSEEWLTPFTTTSRATHPHATIGDHPV